MPKFWLAQVIEELGTQTRLFGSAIVGFFTKIFRALISFAFFLWNGATFVLATLFRVVWKLYDLTVSYMANVVAMTFLSAASMAALRALLAMPFVVKALTEPAAPIVIGVITLIVIAGTVYLLAQAARVWTWTWFVSYTLASWFLLQVFDASLSPWSLISMYSLYPLYVSTGLFFCVAFFLKGARQWWISPTAMPTFTTRVVSAAAPAAAPGGVTTAVVGTR